MRKLSMLTATAALVAAFGAQSAQAASPIVDGTIGASEYAHSVVVDRTDDLGGVYDQGSTGTFMGGFINCHDDWELFWDFDATHIYLGADPLGAGSNCADTSMSMQFIAIEGDPNVATVDCTGTFFSNNLHNFHFAYGCSGGVFTGPSEFMAEGEGVPPSSTWTSAQNAISTTITPIEWKIPRADLNKFGDTTYTGDLQCVWFKVSAFDSRSVDYTTGPGARTIWLKFDPSQSSCTDAPIFGGVGFGPPMENGPVAVKKNRVLPLTCELLDDQGFPVVGGEITALPVLQVLYTPISGPAVDVTDDALSAGHGTDGNQFEFDGTMWRFNLKTKNYSAEGTYAISMISGDTSEYKIDPTCTGSFVIN